MITGKWIDSYSNCSSYKNSQKIDKKVIKCDSGFLRENTITSSKRNRSKLSSTNLFILSL